MVKTIVHHLGLGDQIMLNGMVRYFAETDTVRIFAKRNQEESIRFMYRDIADKVDIVLVDTTNPREVWSQVKGDVIPLATYGMHDENWKFMTQGQGNLMSNWAHGVYIQAGVNPRYMYTKFKVIRDESRELKPEHEKYIFIHDDAERKQTIDVDTDLPVYRPEIEKTPNIFDYITLIENAEQFHGMNSSYSWMVELMKLGNPNKNFFHINIAHTYYAPRSVKTVFSDDIWTFA